MDLLRPGGAGDVPDAALRTRPAAAVPHPGLPLGAGRVCAGCAGAHGEYLDPAPGAVFHWAGGDFFRSDLLPPLAEDRCGELSRILPLHSYGEWSNCARISMPTASRGPGREK